MHASCSVAQTAQRISSEVHDPCLGRCLENGNGYALQKSSCLREFHRERNLWATVHSPWGCKKSDTTELLSLSHSFLKNKQAINKISAVSFQLLKLQVITKINPDSKGSAAAPPAFLLVESATGICGHVLEPPTNSSHKDSESTQPEPGCVWPAWLGFIMEYHKADEVCALRHALSGCS